MYYVPLVSHIMLQTFRDVQENKNNDNACMYVCYFPL